jgi:hypothetical protein
MRNPTAAELSSPEWERFLCQPASLGLRHMPCEPRFAQAADPQLAARLIDHYREHGSDLVHWDGARTLILIGRFVLVVSDFRVVYHARSTPEAARLLFDQLSSS